MASNTRSIATEVEAYSSNPSEDRKAKIERLRKERVAGISMKRKFDVDPIPGWHLHWFREDRVAEAMQRFKFEHVKRDEIVMNALLAGSLDGNTDMGSNVSIVVGWSMGTPFRAFLLKLYEELHDDDVDSYVKNNAETLQAIFGEEAIAAAEGHLRERDALMYTPSEHRHAMRQTAQALFNRPARKAIIGRQP